MLRSVITALFIVIIVADSIAQEYSCFIPSHYKLHDLGMAEGDLNKDGIKDLVMVVYHHVEDSLNYGESDTVYPRRLIILLGGKNGYRLAAQSYSAIMCKDCGGIFGDPFAGVEINKDVLTIYHYGGSNWRWSYTHKFRFQENEWYLIGRTYHGNWIVKECEELQDYAGTEYEDENLVTGEYEVKSISENCELLKNKKGRRKVEPLVSLTKFSIDN